MARQKPDKTAVEKRKVITKVSKIANATKLPKARAILIKATKQILTIK